MPTFALKLRGRLEAACLNARMLSSSLTASAGSGGLLSTAFGATSRTFGACSRSVASKQVYTDYIYLYGLYKLI